ncbi:unnamed protein product [Urochloa decumbens]|uniref:Uncharacterized protein n=1 Tax=Urochloa decumbens TaxID=240449 RepID=A0ABC8W3K7_9POAL
MAFLAPAAGAASLSLRAPMYAAASSGRRSVKAAASSGSGGSPHHILSSLRMAASAAVLLAATSPALACTPSAPPPPPTPLTTAADTDGCEDASKFQKLIVETAELAAAGGAEAARARLSSAAAAEGCDESCARLLAAQALFVDGKADEAIAALEELAREDPADYRPLFCQSVLYRVLGKVAESESALERCRAVSGDAECCAPALMVSAVAGAEAVDAEKAEPETAEV